jgi:hypothetical protein
MCVCLVGDSTINVFPLSSTRSLPFAFPSLSYLHQLPSHLSSFQPPFTSLVCDFVPTPLVHEADIHFTPPPHPSTHSPGSPYNTLRAPHIPLLPVPNVRPHPIPISIHPSIHLSIHHHLDRPPSNLSDAAWQLKADHSRPLQLIPSSHHSQCPAC